MEGLQKRASEAGSRITELSKEGKSAARRAAGKVAASSRQTIKAVKKEWNKMDTAGKVKFVAALLGTLAAASGTLVATKKRR